MLIDGSAIAAILARQAGSEALLARLDASAGPYLTTPVALGEAVSSLARLKAGQGVVTRALLRLAREAVAEFSAALALREVPISADLGRRAVDRMVAGEGAHGLCLSEACAAAYRVTVLAAERTDTQPQTVRSISVAARPPAA